MIHPNLLDLFYTINKDAYFAKTRTKCHVVSTGLLSSGLIFSPCNIDCGYQLQPVSSKEYSTSSSIYCHLYTALVRCIDV